MTVGSINQVEREIVDLVKERDRMKMELEQFEKETEKEIANTNKINDLILKVRRELVLQKVN